MRRTRLRSLLPLRQVRVLSLAGTLTLALALAVFPAVSGPASAAPAQSGQGPTITTTSLPDGTVGASYSQAVDVSGFFPPYTLTVACGSLPPGLSLSSSIIFGVTGSGTISGTPTTPGIYGFNLEITDVLGQTETQALSITIAPAPGGAAESLSIAAAPAQSGQGPTITTTSLPDGTVGASYSQAVDVSGFFPPYTLTVACGSLPPGLSLSNAMIFGVTGSGTISGTPTTPGTYPFTLEVTDVLGQTETQSLSLTVNPAAAPPPQVTTTSLPGGTVGTAYSQTLAASGGTPPYTWSVQSGSLPPGLSLSSGGTISGTPATAGSYDFTAEVFDSNGATGTQSLSIVVNPAVTGTTCTTTITGTHATPLTVSSGVTCLSHVTQYGNITVDAGAGLIVTSSTVNGLVTANGAALVEYCGSTQSGTMTVAGTTGAVIFGDGGSCAADTIPSLVTVSGTAGTVTINGMKENGTLTLSGNTGGVDLAGISLSGLAYVQDNTGTAAVTLSGNTINGSLYCTGNTPPPGDGGSINTVAGSATGQCAGLAIR